MSNGTTALEPRAPGYDTLTAWCESDGFEPDVAAGWSGTRSLQVNEQGQHPEKWVWNQDGFNCTLRCTEEHPGASQLFLQISLPRLLTGGNVEAWVPGSGKDTYDAELAVDQQVWKRLSRDLPDFPFWRVSRLDVTENFQLPGGEPQVAAALDVLQRRRIPRHRNRPYRSEDGDVMWSGKSRRYIAYGKFGEILDRTGDPAVAEVARGVLRAEARVIGAKGVHRVLAERLGIPKGTPVTVHDVLVPDALPVAVERVMGRLEDTVAEAIGMTVEGTSIGIDELTDKLGPAEAARVIGWHLLYRTRGEQWLRDHLGTRQNFHQLMARLRKVGADPRTVDLGLSRQLNLFES